MDSKTMTGTQTKTAQDMIKRSLIADAVVSTLPKETDADMILAERPERLHAVWAPLERILDAIESTGEIDTARGRPVFNEHGAWYEVVPAVAGIVEFHDRAQSRYGIAADTSALSRLAKKLEHGVPVFAADLGRARECIAQCKAQAARLTVSQAVDLVRTVQIGIAVEMMLKRRGN